MIRSANTELWDASDFSQDLKKGAPANEIVAKGEFVEPVEYRFIRPSDDCHLVCVETKVGYDTALFDNISTAMETANYQLHRLLSFDRSVVSDEAIEIVDNNESKP